MNLLKKIAENPYLNLISGFILLLTSGKEILETLDIGAHHGVAFFGMVQIIKCLPDILHGAEQASKVRE